MGHFTLKEWRIASLATAQAPSGALSTEGKVLDNLLLLFEFIFAAMSVGGSRDFNSFAEFAQLFPATTPNEFPLLKTINHQI